MWMCGYRFPCVLCICVTVTPESQIIEFGISVPGTLIVVLAVILISIAGLIDLPNNVHYSTK